MGNSIAQYDARRPNTGLVDSPEEFQEETTEYDFSGNAPEGDFRSIKQWFFVLEEDAHRFERGDRITGQFTAEQVNQNISAKLAESSGYNRQSPIMQWVGGNIETWTFQTRLFSEHRDDKTAEAKKSAIEYLMLRQDRLGRPPLITFYWGIAIKHGITCLIDSIEQTYDEIKLDGSLRGVIMNITLKRWTKFKLEQSPVTRERTPLHKVKHGETYEMIAQRKYGDPMLGVILRQNNPRFPMTLNAPKKIADLNPGELVKIFSINDMTQEKIIPQSHILRTDNFINAENRRYFFSLRSKQVAVLPGK